MELLKFSRKHGTSPNANKLIMLNAIIDPNKLEMIC